jgi:excinuclease ABC subunit A
MDNLSSSRTTDLDQLDARRYIIVKGARVNNLKNLSVAIPRNKLVVITGLSGSGKSSLAFDTLFAEGQRMYVESLSAYARQFLGRMEKPAVEYIRGVAPAIAIKQKNNTKHPRSTVGTATEIYDYLKLLYARVGVTYSPVSGQKVTKNSVSDVVDYIQEQQEGTKILILAPLKIAHNRSLVDTLKIELGKGFNRIMQGGSLLLIEELIADQSRLCAQEPLHLLVDRMIVKQGDEGNRFRMADSVQTAFFEGEGTCLIEVLGGGRIAFSDRFERDGIAFETPSVNFFSFNNPYGACKTCEGFGKVLGIDEDKITPNKHLTVYEGAIVPWKSAIMKKWLDPLIEQSQEFDFPIHTPYSELSTEQKELLWTGNKYFKGLKTFFDYLAGQAHKIQYRVLLSRYRGKKECPDCRGTRVRKDATYVKVNCRSITELLLMSVAQLVQFFDNLTLDMCQQPVAERLLKEIRDRLSYLEQVGLSYLTLNRQVATLSGGEHQRIKLATALGSTLVGTMYILDEPTIGLHPRDTRKLTDILIALKQLGNTIIVVEHEEMVMRAADQIIDIGPEAGSRGGELVFQGDWHALKSFNQSHTARYLNGLDRIPVPSQRRAWCDTLRFQGACEHNLKHIDVAIPLGVLTVITGVSGSGKTTLVKEIVYPAIRQLLGLSTEKPGKFEEMAGDFQKLDYIDFIDQHPIGKSSRSNPSTYVKAYDTIRQLFATQPLSQQRGYQPGQFSFNIEGGRCEACQGEGEIKIEMQFMADIFLTCEHCHGKRFKEETLEVQYQNTNISEVLDMTVEDSLIFFKDQPLILNKLYPLQEVGLGYVRLGQSSNSLSGGEAQRVKLAAYLGKGQHHKHTLFIFDEPTTGLHVHDIHKLLKAINILIREGNSVLIIEHNMEVIKCADWLIDLGPEGGEQGGEVVFKGTPEEMTQLTDNHTAQYLKEKLG